MSTENQSQLPDAEVAYDTIYSGVHTRAFLHKMAQLGYPAKTEAEANGYLDLSVKVAEMHANGTVSEKAAGDVSSFLGEATLALDKLAGVNSAEAQEKKEVKQAAFELANDPKIYAAALVLKHAQAAAAQEPATQSA